MKNFLPDDDRDLVNFLQQHHPTPPPANPHVEAQLMELIERQPRKSTKNASGLFWFLPGAIAMGMVFTWNNQRFLQQTPQFAQDRINLELFVVDSWEETIEDSYFSATPEAEIYQLLSTAESPQVMTSTTFK
ncbi:conserved hypothetical protein [Hyella patelloides LEGE 07179]|uniref:Uncharacterized protein n=1 Tax=Hyella patelloides LEGE 07179 TaxID=945734 RepID=A0A563VUI5_9CYAN|nr:hypothetical protein [Hyella patelloides]VEP15132.1 conserved hypothetical protein [Hyella patelloides LEGE 07179]